MQPSFILSELVSVKFFHGAHSQENTIGRPLNKVKNSQPNRTTVALLCWNLGMLAISITALGFLITWGIEILALSFMRSGL